MRLLAYTSGRVHADSLGKELALKDRAAAAKACWAGSDLFHAAAEKPDFSQPFSTLAESDLNDPDMIIVNKVSIVYCNASLIFFFICRFSPSFSLTASQQSSTSMTARVIAWIPCELEWVCCHLAVSCRSAVSESNPCDLENTRTTSLTSSASPPSTTE